MSRPRTIPDRGDVPADAVARRLGLSLPDFKARFDELRRRGFPDPDPTTGNFCIEAVDRWRLRRHRSLFPELTGASAAINDPAVAHERIRRLFG